MMFDDMDNDERKTSRSGRSSAFRWTLILGSILIIGVVLTFLWQAGALGSLSSQRGTPGATNVTGQAGTATPQKSDATVGDPPIYWQTIEQNIAAGLHLTVAEVKSRLQPPPGQRDSPSIAVIAAQQGIPVAQWRAIEINAIQKGHDLLVRMGYLTQAGSDQGMQTIRNWDQAILDDHVTRWFLNE